MLLLSPGFFVRAPRRLRRRVRGTDYVDRRRVVCGDELAVALPPGGGRLADARGRKARPAGMALGRPVGGLGLAVGQCGAGVRASCGGKGASGPHSLPSISTSRRMTSL